MIDRNLCNTFTSKDFRNENVENLNNTEEEIKEFAIEALNISKNGSKKILRLLIIKKLAFENEIILRLKYKNLEFKNPVAQSF